MKYLLILLLLLGLIGGINLFCTGKAVQKAPDKTQQKKWVTPDPPSIPPARPLETKTPKPATLPPKRDNG